MRNPTFAVFVTILSLSVHGCSPPVVDISEDGPRVSLSAADPIVEFSVQLCYDGPTGRRFATSAHVHADLTLDGGDPTKAIFGQSYLEGEDPVDGPPQFEVGVFSPTDRFAPDFSWRTEGSLGFDIDADELASSGGCLTPRIVRFEMDDTADELQVEVDWRTSLAVEFHRKAPDEETLSIEIQRIDDGG